MPDMQRKAQELALKEMERAQKAIDLSTDELRKRIVRTMIEEEEVGRDSHFAHVASRVACEAISDSQAIRNEASSSKVPDALLGAAKTILADVSNVYHRDPWWRDHYRHELAQTYGGAYWEWSE